MYVLTSQSPPPGREHLDVDAWRVESVHVQLRKEVADRLGAARSMFHAGSVEIPVRLIQSVSDAVVLGISVDGLRQHASPVEGEGEALPTH